VRQRLPWTERFVYRTRFRYFCPSPAAEGKSARVSAAFEPDAAKVNIEVLQSARAAHFQIEPELVQFVVSYAQVKQSLFRCLFLFGCFYD
jgi:hypothetical protein